MVLFDLHLVQWANTEVGISGLVPVIIDLNRRDK